MEVLTARTTLSRAIHRAAMRIALRQVRVLRPKTVGIVSRLFEGESLYAAMLAEGVLITNQPVGFGPMTLQPAPKVGENCVLQASAIRLCWSAPIPVLLASDHPEQVLVTSISVAGDAVGIGSAGAPLAAFGHDAKPNDTAPRRLLLPGQTTRVSLQNLGDQPVVVTGALMVDEITLSGEELGLLSLLAPGLHR